MSTKDDRIKKFGEVFTSEREIHAMLNLVKHETQRIDSRFLEPACGDGNFLIEVLKRKIEIVNTNYKSNQIDYERYAFLAVSSIYGIDILTDNVSKCRNRLGIFIEDSYRNKFKDIKEEFISTIYFIISKNIIHGDALSLTIPNSQEPIVFSEWSFVTASKVQRTDFTLANLHAYQPFEKDTLFSDLGEEAFLPKPSKTFEIRHYLKLQNDKDK